jgi:predicted ATPase
MTVAQEHGSKSLELRAAMSFARLPRRNGAAAEARTLLTAIYEQFTEGHATRDLQTARRLLDSGRGASQARAAEGRGDLRIG